MAENCLEIRVYFRTIGIARLIYTSGVFRNRTESRRALSWRKSKRQMMNKEGRVYV